MIFCSFKECMDFGTCHRTLTDKVKSDSRKTGLPLACFVDKPPCFDDSRKFIKKRE